MSERVFINPQYKPHRELEITDGDWQALKDKLIEFMAGNEAMSTLSVTEARALDPAFSADTVWHQIAQDLGLVEVDIG